METVFFGVFIIFLIMLSKLVTFHNKNKILKKTIQQIKDYYESMPSSKLILNKDGSYSLESTMVITIDNLKSVTEALAHQKIIERFMNDERQMTSPMFWSPENLN